MGLLAAFLTAIAVTVVEIVSKYERAPRLALMNSWSITFILLNGLISAAVFYFVQNIPQLSFGISNPLFKGLIVGTEWQMLLRSKIFTIGEGAEGKEIQVGFEYFYRRYAGVFERQIDNTEDYRVLEEIKKLLDQSEITDQVVKERAIDYINYKEQRKKITKSEAAEHRKQIQESETATIMYVIFELSNLNTLKKVFAANRRADVDNHLSV
jgi:hypothetical protein